MAVTKKKANRFLLMACLALFLLITASVQAAAPEQRAHISAAESGSFDLEARTFFGRGDVELIYDDVTLRGDELYIDLVSSELRLTGNVLFSQDGQEIWGDFLTYNLETGEGSFTEAHSEVELAEKTGIIFVTGSSVQLTDRAYQVADAQFTTCDLENSHYHVEAKELELLVGEKVIIRRVTYYEGKIPLFYWPYLAIPLDTDEEERFFSLPVFGFSEREGYFMKNTFNYQLNPGHYGNIYVDLFSKLGVAAGIRHNYALNDWGDGSLYFYRLPHAASPILKAAWKHKVDRKKWVFNTDTTYEDSWTGKSLNSKSTVKITLPKLSAEGALTYKNTPEKREREFLEYSGRWQQTLTDNWRLNLQGKWTERLKDEERLKLLNYLGEAIYRRDKHTLTLAVEQQYNPDLLTTDKSLSWRTVQRLPELKWEVSDLGFNKLPLSSQLQVGRYGERPSLLKKDRVLGQLALGSKTWRPTDSLSITYRGDGGAAFYSGGDKQSWLYGRIALNQRLARGLTLNTIYTQREIWGKSAFRFDEKKPLQTVTARLSYSQPTWSASINGGYNLKTKSYDLLNAHGSWQPNGNWNLSLSVYHDLDSKTLRNVVPMLDYKAGETRLKIGANYSASKKVFERIDGRFALPLGETWQIGYTVSYKPPQQSFSQSQFTVTKDLHCRTLSAAYDHVQKRVALQYTIKAFPTLPIGWDSASGLELFKFDDIADLVGEGE